MKILITGASGTIGRMLTKALSATHKLVLVDLRSPEETSDLEYRDVSRQHIFERIDMSDRFAVQNLFGSYGLEAVIHMAAALGRQTPWEKILSWNINASINVLEVSLSSQVHRVIYASTNNVYGGYEEKATADGKPLHLQERPPMLQEGIALRPDSRYAVAKLMVEEYATYLSNQFGLQTLGLRIGTVRDIDDPELQSYELAMIPRFKTTWLYHKDLTQLVNLCLTTEVKHGIYNAISGYPGLPGIFIDISKAMEELGYLPKGKEANG